MRIVGGTMRGRPIAAPVSGDSAIRPTTDRARESLFNIIASNWPGKLDNARVLDLFAGTGALGIEALSRGASFALFVEAAAGARGLVRRNIEVLGLQGQTRLFRRDAAKLGACGTIQPFDLVFADPPYGEGLGERALQALHSGGWLRHDALIVLEEATEAEFICSKPYVIANERVMGQTTMRFLQWSPGAGED